MNDSNSPNPSSLAKMRLDKWLWAARFFKTRSLAVDAIEHHRVLVNEQRAKPARLIGDGDRLTIRRGPFEHCVVIQQISHQRGPATQAALLYIETPESRLKREQLAEQLKSQPTPSPSRPTKKARRQIIQFTRRPTIDSQGYGSTADDDDMF